MNLEELRARLRERDIALCPCCAQVMYSGHAHPFHGITCAECCRQFIYNSPHDDDVVDEPRCACGHQGANHKHSGRCLVPDCACKRFEVA